MAKQSKNQNQNQNLLLAGLGIGGVVVFLLATNNRKPEDENTPEVNTPGVQTPIITSPLSTTKPTIPKVVDPLAKAVKYVYAKPFWGVYLYKTVEEGVVYGYNPVGLLTTIDSSGFIGTYKNERIGDYIKCSIIINKKLYYFWCDVNYVDFKKTLSNQTWKASESSSFLKNWLRP